MTTERVIGGLNGDERRASRRARLLDAALEIIGESEWSAATMTAICRRAGLTERYFYESFSCREELYAALIDAVAAEVSERVLGALAVAGDDLEARIGAVAEVVVDVLVRDPRKGRVAVLGGLGDEPLARQRRRILGAFSALVRNEPRRFLGPLTPVPPGAEVLSIAVVGGVDELVTRVLEGTLELSDEELVQAICDFALRLYR